MMGQGISFEREIGEKIKHGFYTLSDGKPSGQIIDSELVHPFTKKISVVRLVDEVVQNGFYTKSEPESDKGFFDVLFRKEQTGLIADKILFEEVVPFERNDKVRIDITPHETKVVVQLMLGVSGG